MSQPSISTMFNGDERTALYPKEKRNAGRYDATE
jgi:hypothetical protein